LGAIRQAERDEIEAKRKALAKQDSSTRMAARQSVSSQEMSKK
jgi:hypothetical protein